MRIVNALGIAVGVLAVIKLVLAKGALLALVPLSTAALYATSGDRRIEGWEMAHASLDVVYGLVLLVFFIRLVDDQSARK